MPLPATAAAKSEAGRLHRVVGIETEYGVVSVKTGPSKFPPLDVRDAVDEVFRPTPESRISTHNFMRNGGRRYVDIGAHPEIAGPECLTLRDLMAQDRAGDLLLERMVDAANERLEEAEAGSRIHLIKSNADSYGNTFGCHENYQVRRDHDLHLGGFVSFLAARQILTGAGALAADARESHAHEGDAHESDNSLAASFGDYAERPLGAMVYSARAWFIKAAYSADPTHERSFINTRDEPHADKNRWRRLHVLAGDSAVSSANTALKAYLGDAVLTLIDDGVWDVSEFELEDPTRSLHEWNYNPNSPQPLRARGKSLTCPQFLAEVLEVISRYLPAEAGLQERCFDLAERGVAALESGNYDSVATELDWAIKYRVLERISEAHGWTSARVRRAELAYHDISARTGLGERLRRAGLIATWIDPQLCEIATTTPPENTRAWVRGKFVTASEETRRRCSVGWAHVRLDDPPSSEIGLPDPTINESAEGDGVIAKMRELGPAELRLW